MKKLCLVFLLVFTFFLNSSAFADEYTKDELKGDLESHALVVIKNNQKKVYDGRGIMPLMTLVDDDGINGAYVADKVVGKAAALLLVYGGASEVYTPMISKSAVKVFKEHNMIYSADKVVNYIVNKSGTGLCPMEKAVRNVNNPNEAYQVFKDMFTNSNHGLIQLNGQQ